MADESPKIESDRSNAISADIAAAIDERDAKRLFQLVIDNQFVLISVNDDVDDEDDDAMGAITAEVDDYEVLVAFTSESLAGEFIESMGDMFGEEDHIQGFIVDGDAMLEYLPEGYGLLLNPETDCTALIEPKLSQKIVTILENT